MIPNEFAALLALGLLGIAARHRVPERNLR
jgi:hypothetical protein